MHPSVSLPPPLPPPPPPPPLPPLPLPLLSLPLLLQDVFQVAEVSKQGRLFPRMSRRHVFLFEKVVVFSKLQEVGGGQQDGRRAQKEAYVYKAHIPVRGDHQVADVLVFRVVHLCLLCVR